MVIGIQKVTLIAMFWLVTAAPAQVRVDALPTPAQVRTLLESSDSKDQAWGAWWVAQARTGGMGDLLQTNLRAHLLQSGHTWQDDAVIDTTLDAFIQLGGNPPPLDVLQAVYPMRPAQTLILLPRVAPWPPVDAFLLKLLDEEADRGEALEWFAAANLLLSHRATGLVASLLRGLRIKATVEVCDKGPSCIPRGVYGSSIGPGGGGDDRSTGFPPWPMYSLGTSNSLAIVAYGPLIVYQRSVISAGSIPFPYYFRPGVSRLPIGTSARHPTTTERLKYVAASAPQLQMPIQGDEIRIVEWRDRQTYAAEVEQFRQDILGRYSSLVQQLRNAGLLSPEDAAALSMPSLEIIVDDGRSVKTPL